MSVVFMMEWVQLPWIVSRYEIVFPTVIGAGPCTILSVREMLASGLFNLFTGTDL